MRQVPFRRVAAETERAGKDSSPGGWRRLGQLLDRNFAEVERFVSAQDLFEFSSSTSSATPLTLGSIPISDGSAYLIEARIVGYRNDGTPSSAGYLRTGTYRISGGVAAIVGSLLTPYTAESDPAWNATLTPSTTNVNVVVTGAAATPISWRAVVKITRADGPLDL